MTDNPNPEEDRRTSTGDNGEAAGETSLGINENMAGLLAYLALWATGIFFLLIEKENSFVRFHAMQSIVVFVPLTIVWIVADYVPIVGGFLEFVCSLITFVLWLFLMFQAFQGRRYKLPYAGDYAETQLRNVGTR